MSLFEGQEESGEEKRKRREGTNLKGTVPSSIAFPCPHIRVVQTGLKSHDDAMGTWGGAWRGLRGKLDGVRRTEIGESSDKMSLRFVCYFMILTFPFHPLGRQYAGIITSKEKLVIHDCFLIYLHFSVRAPPSVHFSTFLSALVMISVSRFLHISHLRSKK